MARSARQIPQRGLFDESCIHSTTTATILNKKTSTLSNAEFKRFSVIDDKVLTESFCNSIGLPSLRSSKLIRKNNRTVLFVATELYQLLQKEKIASCFRWNGKQLRANETVFTLDICDFGVGNINQASESYLKSIFQERCIKNGRLPDLQLDFILNRESLTIIPAGFYKDSQRFLKDVSRDPKVLKYKIKFGPLTVVDRRQGAYGTTLTLSDGFQEINTFSLPTSDLLPKLNDRVMAIGQFVLREENGINKLFLNLDRAEVLPSSLKEPNIFDLSKISKTEYAKPNWQQVQITDVETLKWYIDKILQQTSITLDVETLRDKKNPSAHTIAMVQIGLRSDKTALLIYGDALKELELLAPVLTSEKIEKVIHYAKFETERFREKGIVLNAVTDTWDLIKFLSPQLPNSQLETALFWVSDTLVNKDLQKSDWIPPFSQEQLDYAQNDVEKLSELKDTLDKLYQIASAPLANLIINDYLFSDSEASFPEYLSQMHLQCRRINSDFSRVTLKQLMKALYDTDKKLLEIVRVKGQELEELDKTRQRLEGLIEQRLLSGDCSYRGVAGSAYIGYPMSICLTRNLENHLRERKVEEDKIKQLISGQEKISIKQLADFSDVLASNSQKRRFLSVVKRVLKQDKEAIYIENEFSNRKHYKQIPYTSSKSLPELMFSLNNVVTKALEVSYHKVPLLSILNAKRAVLHREIRKRVAEGDSYDGVWGSISAQPSTPGVSVEALKNMLLEGRDSELYNNLTAFLQNINNRWLSINAAENIYSTCFPNLDPFTVKQIIRGLKSSTRKTEPPQIRAKGII